MFCTNCGKQINNGDNFCGNCGKAIRNPQQRIKDPEPIKAKPEKPRTQYSPVSEEVVSKPLLPKYGSEKKNFTDKHRAELKQILEKNSGKEVSDQEVADAEIWLHNYASLMLKLAESQWKKDQKLKQNPKGFHLEGEGYTCAICRNSVSNEETWYDKWGVKCLICQKAIDDKVIPGQCAKNDELWYSKYDLESTFNLDRKALNRLTKEQVLKPRIVYNAQNKPHAYLFLIKDNQDTLPPKKLVKSQMVKEVRDGQDWFHSEPWYKFADPKEVLKDYKIMDYLVVTYGKKEDQLSEELKMYNDEKANLGVGYVTEYLTKQGYDVIKRVNGETGYDLLATKDGIPLRIEVKTTGNLLGGIPDMHDTEFYRKDDKWFFTADRLYIVRVDKEFQPIQLDILTKEEVDKYADSHKTVTRVRTTKLDRDLFKGNVGTSIKL